MDSLTNFGKGTLAAGIGAADGQLTLQAGGAARFPDPAVLGQFNLVLYNETDYPDPADDPNREIVRVTAVAGEVVSISRAQEGTVATSHNLSGKTHKAILSFTKKTYDDLVSAATNGQTAFSWGNHALAGYLTNESDPAFTSWLSKTPPLYSESDPLSLHLDQSTPQDISGGMPDFTVGLLAAVVGLTASGSTTGTLTGPDFQELDYTSGGITARLMFYNLEERIYIFPNQSGTVVLSPDLAAYFKLDQSTPQTVSGGIPIFAGGLNIPSDVNLQFHDANAAIHYGTNDGAFHIRTSGANMKAMMENVGVNGYSEFSSTGAGGQVSIFTQAADNAINMYQGSRMELCSNYGIDVVGVLRSDSDGARDLGTSTQRFRDLLLSRNLADGTNTVTVLEAKTAYDHSQDNTQAHSDYLLNNADDTFAGQYLTLQYNGSVNGLIIDNIATDGDPGVFFRLNGVAAWHIAVDDSDADSLLIGTGGSVGGGTILKFGSTLVTALKNLTFSKSVIYFPPSTLDKNSATPSVSSSNVFTTGNTSATSITNFPNGSEGQVIWIKASDNNTTFVDGTYIKLAGSANFNIQTESVIGFVLISSVWYEIARSVN